MNLASATKLLLSYRLPPDSKLGLMPQAITCGSGKFTGNYNFPTSPLELHSVISAILFLNSHGHPAPFQQSYRSGFPQRLIVDIDCHEGTSSFEYYQPINRAVLTEFKKAFPKTKVPKWRFALKPDPTKGACIYYDIILDKDQCAVLLNRARLSIDIPENIFDTKAPGRRIVGTTKDKELTTRYRFLPWMTYPKPSKNTYYKPAVKTILWSLPYAKGRNTFETEETEHTFFEEVAAHKKPHANKNKGDLEEGDFNEGIELVKKKYGIEFDLKTIKDNCAFGTDNDTKCPFHDKIHQCSRSLYYLFIISGNIRFGCAHPHKQYEWLKYSRKDEFETSTAELDLLLEGEVGHQDIFYELLQDQFFAHESGKINIWDPRLKVFVKISRDGMAALLARKLHSIITDTLVSIEEQLKIKPDAGIDSKRLALLNNKAKWCKVSHARGIVTHLIQRSIASPESKCFYKKLEYDPYTSEFFPIEGGFCVNLRTGEYTERTPRHIFTDESEYNPLEATAEALEKIESVLRDIMDTQEKYTFLQTLCGRFISGVPVARELDIFVGPGASGKSTILALLTDVMGMGLSKAVSHSTVSRGNNNHSYGERCEPEIVDFFGKRFACTSELEDGSKIYSRRVKELTSGIDKTSARGAYDKSITEFTNRANIVIATNFLPEFDTDDTGLSDRVRYLDFKYRFMKPEDFDIWNPWHKIRDEGIIHSLSKEAFLSWCIEGAKKYYSAKNVLKVPDCVINLKKNILQDMDSIQKFINACLLPSEGSMITSSEMWELYSTSSYADKSISSLRTFVIKMQDRLNTKTKCKKIEGKEKQTFVGWKYEPKEE